MRVYRALPYVNQSNGFAVIPIILISLIVLAVGGVGTAAIVTNGFGLFAGNDKETFCQAYADITAFAKKHDFAFGAASTSSVNNSGFWFDRNLVSEFNSKLDKMADVAPWPEYGDATRQLGRGLSQISGSSGGMIAGLTEFSKAAKVMQQYDAVDYCRGVVELDGSEDIPKPSDNNSTESNSELIEFNKNDADSDSDGVPDNRDESPNQAFDSRFTSISSLSFVPATPIEDKFERESKATYNTNSMDTKSALSRAQLQASLLSFAPAGRALARFLQNKSDAYDFGNDWNFLETYRGREWLAKNTNSLIDVIEATVKDQDKLAFATAQELTGSDFSTSIDDLADIMWWYAVGSTRATMVAMAERNNNNYEMTLVYRIVDFYDWRCGASITKGGFGGMITDDEMCALHTNGQAQEYRIEMTYRMKVKWTKGDRYYLDAVSLWQTPKNMSVERL